MSLMSLVQQKDQFGDWCAIGHLPLSHYILPQRLVRPVDKLQKRGTFDSWHDDLRSQGHVLYAGEISAAWRAQGLQWPKDPKVSSSGR